MRKTIIVSGMYAKKKFLFRPRRISISYTEEQRVWLETVYIQGRYDGDLCSELYLAFKEEPDKWYPLV